MVGHTPHFSGPLLKMKAILDSGRLGPLMTIVCFSCKNWTYANRAPQYRSRFHGGGMWLTNGVHVVDRLTWLMASQAASVSASIGTRAHYQAADDTATALIRYKNGLAGVAVSIAFADGPPIMDTQVICTNGTVRIIGGRQPVLQVGQGDEWEDIPFEVPSAVMHYEWKSFVQSIEQDIEPPTSGEWSRHIMEILFAAETSAISGQRRRPGKRPLLDPPARRHPRHPRSRLDLRRTAAPGRFTPPTRHGKLDLAMPGH